MEFYTGIHSNFDKALDAPVFGFVTKRHLVTVM